MFSPGVVVRCDAAAAAAMTCCRRRRRCGLRGCCLLFSLALAAVPLLRSITQITQPLLLHCPPCERIDVVYTWVNGSDPHLMRAIESYRADDEDARRPSRFDDKHELKYSLRSLEKYAPWIGDVYIVTADQLPSWLDVARARDDDDGRRLTVIPHSDIIPGELLPTFSSPAIECFLHKIPGLSERFLYFNDDIFLGAPVHMSDFYTPSDGYEVYTAWGVPDCVRGCPWSFLGDGSCDRACDNVACDYDGGDCSDDPKDGKKSPSVSDYAGDYVDSQFFDDDDDDREPRANVANFEKYPGEKSLNGESLQARQVQDEQLLLQLLDSHREEKDASDKHVNGRNILSLKRYQSNISSPHRVSVESHESKEKADVKSKFPTNSSRYTVHKKPLSKNMHILSTNSVKKSSQFKEVLFTTTSNKTNNITHVISRYNRNIIRKNKEKRKKRNIPYDRSKSNKSDIYNDSRKLDIYAKSLIHTNKIFNKEYGFQNRKVPAHVPFLLEKKTIERMQSKFSHHVDVTKSNKFRRPDDFQFGFAYYHYLMSEREPYTVDEIFDSFDTDRSGTWSDREVRTVLTKVHGLPLTAATVHAMETVVKACDREEYRSHPTPPNERYMDSDMPTVTKELVMNCPELKKSLTSALGKRNARAFARPAASRAIFAMLSSNITKAVTVLDEIRRDTKKFICINDNLDWKQEDENEIIRMVLQELYDALLPLPSRWELPPNVANRFLRLSELRAWHESRKTVSQLLLVCAALLIVLTSYQTNCHRFFVKHMKKIM